jgi:hypothetical protein
MENISAELMRRESKASSSGSATLIIGLLGFGVWWFYTRIWDFSGSKRGLVFALE